MANDENTPPTEPPKDDTQAAGSPADAGKTAETRQPAASGVVPNLGIAEALKRGFADYLEKNDALKAYGHTCQGEKPAVATGTVTEKDGKKWLTATKIEAPKS